MDNKQALSVLLRWYDTFCKNEACGLIDLNFKVIATNPWCQDFCSSDTSLLGQDFFNIWKVLSDVKREALKRLLCDLLVQKNNLRFISANFSRRSKYVVALFEYKPLINSYTDEVIAIQLSAVKNYPLRFYDIKRTLPLQPIDNIVLPDDAHGLTLMELEIAFLLFQAENYSEIADIMSIVYGKNISKSLIAKIVRRSLYEKFKVYNLKSLKNILYENRYHLHIPSSLVSESIIILD